MDFKSILNFVMGIDWGQIIEGLLMILGGASIIAKLTPTDWDDKMIGKAINFVGLAKKVN